MSKNTCAFVCCMTRPSYLLLWVVCTATHSVH